MNKRNYQKELDELLTQIDREAKKKPSLLLHCCCAPCSSYVLEYLSPYFQITLFFYNPNITEKNEYEKRKTELRRYVAEVPYGKEIQFCDSDYNPELFLNRTKGLEQEPERGLRCENCFSLRLTETAKKAKEGKYDFFCTTLSISPHKNADLLMKIGEELAAQYELSYLPSDFKKKNGYKRSIELSKEYCLYRQNYCGCVFSREVFQKRESGE